MLQINNILSLLFIIISLCTAVGVYWEELIVTAGDTVDLMRLLLTLLWWEIVRLQLLTCFTPTPNYPGDRLISFLIAFSGK